MKSGWRFKSPYILQNLIWIPTRFLFKLFFRIEIIGAHILRELAPGIIFAVNHTSELDAIILPSSLSFFSKHLPMFYVSREKSFYIKSGWRQAFYGGWLFRAWGAHAAKVGLHDYGASLETHTDILLHGGSLCIFPEAKRNLDGLPKKAKGGVAYLVYKTDKPVIPVFIEGARHIKFVDFLLCRRRIKIIFGKPIYKKKLFEFCTGQPVLSETRDDFIEAAQEIMSAVWQLEFRDKTSSV